MSQPAVGDLNLADGHFTTYRWKRFLKDYTDESFPSFLDRCLAEKTWEEGYSCPVRGNHTHGNCLVGLIFTNSGELTLFSRVTQVHPTSVLDLCFGSAVARYLEAALERRVTLSWVICSASNDHNRCMAQLEYHDAWHLCDQPNPNRFVKQMQANRDIMKRDPDQLLRSGYNGYRIIGKDLERQRAGVTRDPIVPELNLIGAS